jgi:hypothetical protein
MLDVPARVMRAEPNVSGAEAPVEAGAAARRPAKPMAPSEPRDAM